MRNILTFIIAIITLSCSQTNGPKYTETSQPNIKNQIPLVKTVPVEYTKFQYQVQSSGKIKALQELIVSAESRV